MRASILILALAFGPVWADGVPLITSSGRSLTTANPELKDLAKKKDFVKIHPVTFNKNAFGANVLTVVIDGKEHRFVGSMLPKEPKSTDPYLAPQPVIDHWMGFEGDRVSGANLILTRDARFISGSMFLPPHREFRVVVSPTMGAYLIETNPARSPRGMTLVDPASAPALKEVRP